MSSTIDPVDSVYDGMRASFGPFALCGAVSLGGHFFGAIADHVGKLAGLWASSGASALWPALWPDANPAHVLFSWAAVFLASFAHWAGWLFLLVESWILVRLRAGDEAFGWLLLLAVVQPIHSFVIKGIMAPRGALENVAGGAFLFVTLGLLVALALGWWQIREEAPEPGAGLEGEPEL